MLVTPGLIIDATAYVIVVCLGVCMYGFLLAMVLAAGLRLWLQEGEVMARSDAPHPGSDAAIAIGCICPVLDNSHGQGYLGIADVYVISAECPVHANKIKKGEAGD